MTATASWPEVAFTLPSALGFLISCALLYLCAGDEIERRRVGVNGVVRLDVQKSIVTAVALVVALGCLTAIGVNALATPPNPNIATDPTTATAALLNALLFVVVDAALIALAAYRLLQRTAVLAAMRQDQRRDRRKTDRPGGGG